MTSEGGCGVNNLQLNGDKTELIVISPVRQTNNVNNDSLKVGGYVVKAASTPTNLGTSCDNK